MKPTPKLLIGLLLAAIFALSGGTVRAATPEQVEEAIKKAVDYLYTQQKGDNWEEVPAADPKGGDPDTKAGQWGGRTAIVVYSLLAAGESPQDPRIKKSIEFLKGADIKGVYALGMRAQVWNLIPMDDSVKTALTRDFNLIANATKTEGESRGFYDYLNNGKGGRIDHSVSQYGVLGMWALAQTGVEIPITYWKAVDDAWKRDQGAEGGWKYDEGKPSAPDKATMSMTAAGVATLFISQDYLSVAEGAQTRGNITNASIEAGMKWIGERFKKPDGGWWAYTLYGIERIGVASGYKYLGKNNWYEQGSQWFVEKQGGDGAWDGDHGRVPNTAFGILFLTRGRAPVVMNKLQYDLKLGPDIKEGNWNQRPRDVANITRWIGRQLERDLNWQIVNLNVSADDLHDSQILFISGDQDLTAMGAEDQAKLKKFVEQGGMIFGNSDGRSRSFNKSFQDLGVKLFGGKFRPLPDDHPIYREQFPRTKWRNKPIVLGLSNGARELMILMPESDPARFWQIQLTGGREELWQMMANIFLYSVDRQNLRVKGQTYLVKPDATIPVVKTTTVLRGKYDGNWDPEPGGWVRLDGVMHNAKLMDVKTKVVEIGKDPLVGGKILHITGTQRVKFSPEQRTAIKKFVEDGGTLVVDATGGSPEFVDSIEPEFDMIFGPSLAGQLKKPLPDDAAIYSAGGKKIEDVRYRSHARRMLTGDLRAARLRGIKIGDRLGVIHSPEDLSAGLVGQPVDGIIGYDPDTATALMRNILLYVK